MNMMTQPNDSTRATDHLPDLHEQTDDWWRDTAERAIHDLAATLVHSARSSDVRTTIVDGRVLMRDRELLTIDVDAVVGEMGERMPALLDRSHGRRIQDYDT